MKRSLLRAANLSLIQSCLIIALLCPLVVNPAFAETAPIDDTGFFGSIGQLTKEGIGLTGSNTAKDELIEELLNQHFSTKDWSIIKLSAEPTTHSNVTIFQLAHAEIAVCDYTISVHEIPNRNPSLSGRLPRNSANFREGTKPNSATVIHQIRKAFPIAPYKFIRNCWHELEPNQFEVTSEYSIISNEVTSHIRVTNLDIVHSERLAFDTTAETKIFDRNPKNSKLVSTIIPDMTGDGSLSGHYFKTVAGPNSIRANNSDNKFMFTPEAECPGDITVDTQCYDSNFMEASIYTNAMEVLRFFCSLGFTDSQAENACEPTHPEYQKRTNLFLLKFGARYGGDVNTAFYAPGDPPIIQIGEGDGNQLQALGVERDVVIHEFSHHVIYKYLQKISGQSKELHEGIADFFTVSFNNDPCFAPSICPQDSSACYVQNECLRSAATDLNYNDENLTTSEHLRGQIISGMLWDLVSSNTIPKEVLTQLTFESLAHLSPSGSSRAEFVFALLMADLNQPFEDSGCYGCSILTAGVKRGLVGAGALECDMEKADACIQRKKDLPKEIVEPTVLSNEIESPPPASPTVEETPTSRSSDQKWYQCGTIGLQPTGGGMAGLLLIIPMLIGIRSRKKNHIIPVV